MDPLYILNKEFTEGKLLAISEYVFPGYSSASCVPLKKEKHMGLDC